MKQFTQLHREEVSGKENSETKKKRLTVIEKQEKRVSIGIYTLIIIITVSLMLIIFNIILRG